MVLQYDRCGLFLRIAPSDFPICHNLARRFGEAGSTLLDKLCVLDDVHGGYIGHIVNMQAFWTE